MFKRIARWVLSGCKQVVAGSGPPGRASAFAGTGPAPVVPQVLLDVPGGQQNLLPVSALTRPLRVEVPLWPSSAPEQGEETLWLFWDGVELERRHWTAPIPPQDLLFDVPVQYLVEGRPAVHYQVAIYNGQTAQSAPLVLTIDLTGPGLATPDGLQFDPQVLADGVTVEYLENHNDQLLGAVPDYAAPVVGDCIRYYWDSQAGSTELVGEKTLALEDLGKPIELVFDGSMIRDRGDGDRQVHYRITDRAGNQSRASGVVTLAVTATPAPRILSWPLLSKGTGTGETVVLELGTLGAELEAVIPEDAGVGSREPVEMQWAEPGHIGAATLPGSPGSRRFSIPFQRLAAHSGKTIPLYYKASGDVSTQRLVKVNLFKPSAPPPQVLEADTNYLSLAKVSGAARITQYTWGLVSTDQRVKVRVQGQGAAHTVAEAYPVSQADIDAGLLGGKGALTVPKTFLQGLPLNSWLTFEVSVSLDGGVSWPSTPDFTLQLTLIA